MPNQRIKFIALLLMTSFTSLAYAEADDQRGYSFFMALGQQRLHYEEKASILPVKTSVDVTNPLIITGALYAISDDLLVSLDAETTFAADTTTEKWKSTSDVFAGTPLTSSVLQEDQFKLQQSGTRLLGHYRLKDHWFVITGPAFHSQTFKRFGFQPGVDNATTIVNSQVIEESSSEILWQLGVALESEQLKDSKTHYSARLYTGIPLWRELDNTLVSSHTFDGTSGQDWTLEGRYSYAVHPKIHVGVWGQYIVSYRDSQKTCIAYAGANSGACGINQAQAELPESRFNGLGYGIELLWKL
jgi:hypothetical protein